MEKDIEELKRLFYANALTQYGKRKLISYYEQRYKELEEENKNLKKGIVRLKKKRKELESEIIDVKVDKVTKNYIPTSVIWEKIDELEEEIEQLERRQNEIIGCDGDDTLTREEIWFVEDKIYLLKKILEEGRK